MLNQLTEKACSISLKKKKTNDSIPDNVILATADIVGLYPKIPYLAGLEDLKEDLQKRDLKRTPT